ncbi:signal transduction histidine kinase [Methanolinea mesophila]|uniref:histidine kinase N-terminal 7TM domain-containing protein n=1 Tax=Methanolinea mesophila TaxID=547055 RepID=UPI001AE7EFC4|nr:histidine kinase N-terminal 7TM domain-containing protein [Methanolinea mesophila]MBP1929829.1 signal transduction histidine kinase [Methanolinea mesophila]
MSFFSFTPLVYAGLIATVILVFTGILSWRFRSTIVGRVAVVILACASIYSFLLTLSLGITDPAASLALIVFELPFRLFLPILSFFFILLYIGEIQKITLRILALTSAVPLLIFATALTSPFHPFFASNLVPVVIDDRIFFSFTPGPVFWLQVIYSSVLIIAGVTLVVSRFFNSPPIYRIQITAIMAAFILPFFIHLSLIFLPGSSFAIALSLLAFVVTAAGVYIATSRYQFLTLTPVAYPTLINRMTDGVIILNIQGLIVEANPAAARILGKEREHLIGQPAGRVLPEGAQAGDGSVPQDSMTITLSLDGAPYHYDLRHIPLHDPDNLPAGTILMLHDSNVRHLTELGLRRSNEKLQLLTSIIRHDVLNTLTALVGSIELARTSGLPERSDRYLEDAERYADVLQGQIEFTRDYQTLGLHSARWQNVRSTIAADLPAQSRTIVAIDPALTEVVVFADPMFGRVFYNLVDNSLRHGGFVSRIRITGTFSGEEYLIMYEDNGTGIPSGEKEKIFDKAYGKNTGLGLFLTREILALTGITISETGMTGNGARFEIRVPRGGFRVTRD